MRLCKPSFHFALPVPFPPAAPDNADPGVALSPMLALPQSFGDIYLGETFSCYISLCNVSPVELAQVGLKVEVQTQLQRETLADATGESIGRFASQQTLDKIIEYDLKDVGIHILICSALYTDAAGERKYFRKFFKFQVNNPLSMKSKTHALSPHNEVLIETQLQNAMPRQLFLQSVDFKPAPQFEVTSLNAFPPALAAPPLAPTQGSAPSADATPASATAATTAEAAPAGAAAMMTNAIGLPSFGSLAHLKGGDTQQYMFRLRGKVPPAQLRQVTTLGRMEVVWTSAMGEAGRLQSNTVQRKLPAARGVEIHLLSAPSEVELETPFEITCSVTNTSSSEMQLQLTAAMMLPPATAAIVVDGVCTRNLGTFRPHSSQSITIRLLPIEPGMQKVTGLQLIDVLTEQVHEIGSLADVFVLHHRL